MQRSLMKNKSIKFNIIIGRPTADKVASKTDGSVDKKKRLAEIIALCKENFESELIALAADSNIALKFVLTDYKNAINDPDPEVRSRKFENRLVAIPVVNMLMNLHTMQFTDKILANATKMIVENYQEFLDSQDRELNELIFRLWIVAIDGYMIGESLFQDEYDKRRTEVRDTFSINSPVSLWWSGSTIVRRAFVNKIFMKQAFDCRCQHNESIDEERKQHLLIKAIVKMAKDTDDRDSLNLVYNYALHEIAKDLPAIQNDENAVKDKLLATVKRLLEEDAELGIKVDRTLMSWEVRGVDFNLARNNKRS